MAAGFLLLFVFGPDRVGSIPASEAPAPSQTPLAVLDDGATQLALTHLQDVSPATYSGLEAAAVRAIADGADAQKLSRLVLEALFSQFQSQALTLRSANSDDYQTIIAGLATGLRSLKSNESPWCEGTMIADFLTQNDDELVPALLDEFTYMSPQYEWAMGWMATILTAIETGRNISQPHARPNFRDEAVLQQEGLALGSEQWALALQIAAFANAEGTSYAQMREVIAGMDVCDLGIAVETVSGRLPSDVKERIWGDLMPEIMVGNTPYVIWRVTDYFFIG